MTQQVANFNRIALQLAAQVKASRRDGGSEDVSLDERGRDLLAKLVALYVEIDGAVTKALAEGRVVSLPLTLDEAWALLRAAGVAAASDATAASDRATTNWVSRRLAELVDAAQATSPGDGA